MRIAYISADPGVPIFGRKGSSIHVQEVLRSLIKKGASIDLFANRFGGDCTPGLETITIHTLPQIKDGDVAEREDFYTRANKDLYELLKKEGPFDLVYERYSLWSFAGMQYAHDMVLPGVLEVNAPLIEEQEKYRTLVNRDKAQYIAKRVFSLAKIIIAVSRLLATYVRKYPCTRGCVHVIPNAVNPDRFCGYINLSSPAADGTFTVGFVGSLKPWHGLDVLFEAFSRIYKKNPMTRLLIVGDGKGRKSFEEDLKRKGLIGAVHFAGIVSPNDVPGFLASMDVAVAPYEKIDGFYFSPLKVYEYMAAGLPVIASRIGQLRDIISSKEDGILCTPGSPSSLARAIELLRRDPQLRTKLGKQARVKILNDHTWDIAVNRILKLAGVDDFYNQRVAEVSW